MSEQGVTIFLDVKTSDGTSFLIYSFNGRDRISDLFEYTLFMTAENRDVSFDSLMGQSAVVSITLGSEVQYFNGIIGRFEQVETPFNPLPFWTSYKVTLRPKLWRLTFSGQCRIFQNKSSVEIITSILEDNQIPYSNQVTSSGMQPLEFCVQYNETDFNFISRLMEQEGIFYFFQQSQENHTMVLADSVNAYPSCQNITSVGFNEATSGEQMMLQVSSCFITQQIVPQSNTITSYNYLTPQTALKATAAGNSNAGGGGITTYNEIYDQQSLGDELVKIQLQSEEFPQKMVHGITTVPFFLAGCRFTLTNHPRSDANIDYVLYEVVHDARIYTDKKNNYLYKNNYHAFAATTLFRPAQKTSKPRIYGTQTAVVTGKPEEEIHTEEYGRIKVKFHWDPSESQDDTTSCWIRVATLWAGQTWGTLFTPRVGHEVVVSFIDGDPDKPLVIGSVYNGQNKPPYLPDTPTKSTIKTQTSKKGEDGTPGYNELRFEDLQGSEEIYIQAQKDLNMYIQNDQNITIVGGNRTITLQSQDEKGEQRAGNQSNDSLKLMNGNKSLEIVQGNYTILLDQGNITVTCAQGDVSFDVTGNISFKCTGNFSVDASQSITFTAGESISGEATNNVSLQAGASANLKAGGDASVEATGKTTVAGSTVAVEGAVAVQVTGGMITLNG